MHRILRNGDNVVRLAVEGLKFISQSGKEGGKMRESVKEFAKTQDALKAMYKKEWESLKKGFTLYNEAPKFGEARLHRYIGGGYTGAMSFAQAGDEFWVYKNTGSNDKVTDFIVGINEFGGELGEAKLPKPLAWDIVKFGEKLVLNLDHHLYEYDLASGKFTDMKDRAGQRFGVQICARAGKLAVASDQIYIFNETDDTVRTIKFELGKGDAKVALSRDGLNLAVAKEGEISLFDTASGSLLLSAKTSVKKVAKIAFIGGDLLAVRDYYGYNEMKFIRLDTGEETAPEWLKIDKTTPRDIDTICVSDDESKLALIGLTRAYIFDLTAHSLRGEFYIEHIVKRCEAKFTSNGLLAVRTDYGCFSLYGV